MFDALRLSMEALAEVLLEVLMDIAADIAADIINRTELNVRVEIRQLKELEVFDSLKLSVVLLLAVCCWDSLKS